MKRTVLLLVLFATTAHNCSYAQNESVLYLALTGTMGIGNFGNADASYGHRLDWGLNRDSEKGGAGLGLGGNFGVWLGIPGSSGLKAGYDIAFTYTGMNADIKEYYDDYLDDVEDYMNNYATNMSNYKLKLPKYILAPFTFGLRYDFGPFDVSGGIGFSMNMITNMVEQWKDHSKKADAKVTYDVNMFSFAWRIGLGIRLSDEYSVMVSYYNLGTLKVSAKQSGYNYYTHKPMNVKEIKVGDITPTMLSLTIRKSFSM